MAVRMRPLGALTLGAMLAVVLIPGSHHVLSGATKQVVTAARLDKSPASLDDAVWRAVPGVDVPYEGKERFVGKKLVVATKAAYTDDSLYFLFTWPDATHSVTKSAWQFDGKTWTRLPGDEDRLAVLFEINRIDQFATKGCAVACHVPSGQPTKYGKFGTKTEAEKGDLWHWKAARSAPYGHADDGWLTMATDSTGRKNDGGAGGDFNNQTPDKSKPLLMRDPAKPPSVPGFLLREEAVEIKDYGIFKAGDVIPSRLPVRPEGSRFDVKAMSRHANGTWHLMLWRKLKTDSEDDVTFDPRRDYNMAFAVFDDSGDEHSYDSEVLTLRFRR